MKLEWEDGVFMSYPTAVASLEEAKRLIANRLRTKRGRAYPGSFHFIVTNEAGTIIHEQWGKTVTEVAA